MKVSQMVFNLCSGYVQRSKGKLSKEGKPEFRFMCSARCLIMLYICVKFLENIRNSIRDKEQTQVHKRNGYVQCSKGNNSKSRQTRVTVHVLYTSSYNALHWCEVSWKYLRRYQSYGAETK